MEIFNSVPLTLKYPHISNVITCSVELSHAKEVFGDIHSVPVLAIWDTGAMGSAICALTAQKLGLISTGRKDVSGLGGTFPKNTYLVDIILPNKIPFLSLSVTELDNPVDANGQPIDSFGILIGMDIINTGDFSITNHDGQTCMSFRYPSIHCVDYVKEHKIAVAKQGSGFRQQPTSSRKKR